jgi:hypothetical protein
MILLGVLNKKQVFNGIFNGNIGPMIGLKGVRLEL